MVALHHTPPSTVYAAAVNHLVLIHLIWWRLVLAGEIFPFERTPANDPTGICETFKIISTL